MDSLQRGNLAKLFVERDPTLPCPGILQNFTKYASIGLIRQEKNGTIKAIDE
jgi:hypothetical protein